MSQIDRIFFPLNVDDNCRLISRLLQPVKLQIYHLLKDGKCDEAVTLYVQLIQAMCEHFIKDRHYIYIDSCYALDLDCTDIFRWFQQCKEAGTLTEELQNKLQETFAVLRCSKVYQEYGIPSVCKLKF